MSHVLQYVAVCCSMLQYVAVRNFKCVVVCCSVLLQRVAVCDVSCVVVCCSMLQYVAVCRSAQFFFSSVAARCSVGFQVCCNVLQCAPHK